MCAWTCVCGCVHLLIFIVFDCVRILYVYTCTHVYIEFICECLYLCLSVCMYYKRVGKSQTCDVFSMMEWSYVTWDFLMVTLGFCVATMYCFVNFIDLCSTKLLIPCHYARRKHGQSPSWALQLLWLHCGQPAMEIWTTMRTGRKSTDPLMALMGATPFTQDMEIWIYHCQHRSMTSTSRLDLCHLSTPSCFRQLFQQHIMLPLCLHLGRNHLVQGFLHSLLLLKNHGMFVLIQTNEAEGWERFQTLITY